MALARRLPVIPVPVVVERTPPTRGQRRAARYADGVGERPVLEQGALPAVDQRAAAAAHRVLYCQLRLSTWVRLLLERARSAEVSR